MSKLSRRDFLKASVMATGGILLAGCAPAAQPTEAAKEAPKEEAPGVAPQTIQYWVFWGGYNQAVPDFTPALLEYIKPHQIDIKT
ncbi:MAG: twin-arginine translocation signal domain-containing protein, partial [Anaerolineaceae bacterium]|nr:twin-arginine translocation signal domain-containing protein [Anaerolineaceae bacterium]